MSEKLQSCIAIEDTYPIVNYFARKLFPTSSGVLYMHDACRNLYEAVTLWGKSPTKEKSFGPDDCLAVRQRKIYLSHNGKPDLPCPHLHGRAGSGALCIPLLAHGEILGILHLQKHTSDTSSEKYDAGESSDGINEEMQLAVTVFGHLSLTLSNIKLKHSLQQQAICDPLTELYNRRYMEETLVREVHRANRLKAPLGIIMIDLDHFRRFNNTYGHDAGDTVLKEVGKFLKDGIRKEDVACRYGGEEFILILPSASLETTYERAEKLRCMAADLKILHQGNVFSNITLSAGIAVYPNHGSTWETVLQASDAALYRAKNEGRNRVAVYGSAEAASQVKAQAVDDELVWKDIAEESLGYPAY
jgi:diguanylate cyclase (GGDEF)-like protein